MELFQPTSWRVFLTQALATVVGVGVAVATVILTSQLVGPLPLTITQTTTEKTSAFTVTGESELVTVPDEAQASLGISVRRDTVAAAQDEANRVINAIGAQIKALGIEQEDIKTSNYSIYPEYNYQSGNQEIIGYSVNANLSVKIKDLEKINQVIDSASQVGANQIGGITFGLSTESETKLRAQARQEAIADAKASATELANLAGMRLGKIINVSEGRADDGPIPIFADAKMSEVGLGGGEPTQIEPGSATYTYQVTLSYETL